MGEKEILKGKNNPIYGLVLSGGKSTRMGSEKALIQFRNHSFVEHTFQLLHTFCKKVFISCRQDQVSFFQGLPIIEDMYKDIGPLAGLLAAGKKYPDAGWAVLGVDMPHITPPVFAQLIQNRNVHNMGTVFYHPSNDAFEPLCAIYEHEFLPVLENEHLQGHHSLQKILHNYPIHKVIWPKHIHIHSINTIQDLNDLLAT